MSQLLNIYSSKINNYKNVYLEKELYYWNLIKENKKKELVSRSSYFFYDLMDNDLIFNKFIAYFTKKSEKAKHYNILYRAFKYIKFSIKQQPSLFLTKSLKVNNLFFEVWELHLKKRIIYIPKTLEKQRKFHCSFGFLMRKLFFFNKMLSSKMEIKARLIKKGSSLLSFNRIASFKTIEERLAFFLISTGFLRTFEKLITRYTCHLNKIVLKNRFKLFRRSKSKKWRKRRKGKFKLIKKQRIYFDIKRKEPIFNSIKPHKVVLFHNFNSRVLDRSWKQGKWIG